MNFIMIGLLLGEALVRLRVRFNMYLVSYNSQWLDWSNWSNIINQYTGPRLIVISQAIGKKIILKFISSGWEQLKSLGVVQTVCHWRVAFCPAADSASKTLRTTHCAGRTVRLFSLGHNQRIESRPRTFTPRSVTWKWSELHVDMICRRQTVRQTSGIESLEWERRPRPPAPAMRGDQFVHVTVL